MELKPNFASKTPARSAGDYIGAIERTERTPPIVAADWIARYLMDKLGRVPQADAKTVAETLDRIWVRTLYGVDGTDDDRGKQ